MAIKHAIRKNGQGEMKVVKLTARRAIQENCKECLGWEVNPKDCSSPHCALFPFRGWDTPKDTI